MSYLKLQNGVPDFAKAVISLWFRVPRVSVIAAVDNSIGDETFPLMSGIIPLLTFGKTHRYQTYNLLQHEIATFTPFPGLTTPPYFPTDYFEEGPSYDVNPSYIGLRCYDDGTVSVEINIQTDTYVSLTATTHEITGVNFWSTSDPNAPVKEASIKGSGVITPFPYVATTEIVDVSYTNNNQPAVFTVLTTPELQPDQWHHLLLSFDVSGSASIGTPFASTGCKLWYAIDDKDYRGAENLQPYRDVSGQWGRDSLDDNAILPYQVWRFSGSDPNWEAPQFYQNHFVGLPSGGYGGGDLETTEPLGLPATEKHEDAIFRCEMAELQMWTGVILDTEDVNNRRIFIDADGKPVDPMKPAGKNDKRWASEKLLGKKPEILLHNSGNWQEGYNTGTLGVERDEDGNTTKLPDGQFRRTAKIEKFKPEPALSKKTG